MLYEVITIVLLDDVREIMFDYQIYDKTLVEDFMSLPPETIEFNEHMDEVMRKFEDSKAWNLPVVNNGVYMGFVSKSKIFSVYRKVLNNFSYE